MISTTRILGRPVATIACLALIACTSAGCGGVEGPERVSVSGTVTLDGKPLADGKIAFKDAAEASATEVITITEGEFSGEITPGSKHVEIRGYKTVTPDMPAGAPEAGTPIQKQILPARYNVKSDLTADVSASGEPLKYELTSGN